METITLAIPQMTCGGCAQEVRSTLAAMPGVGGYDIDLRNRRLRVTTRDGATAQAVRERLAALGYPTTTAA